MHQNYPDNALYEMDNLPVLRGMNSDTVDLIATDAPFNIKRNRAGTAGFYVDNWKWGDTGTLPDQWKWNEVHPKWLEEIQDNHRALYHAIDAAKQCQGQDTSAFLCFLSVRLIEMHRILKPTGSLYLHCDTTASHYIKMCLDAIFGKKNFRNEIVWHYRRWTAASKRFQKMHDIILYYTKTDSYTFTKPLQEYSDERYIENTVRGMVDGRLVRLRADDGNYIKREKQKGGVLMHDVWSDINFIAPTATERKGSPDQKPLALYERIIKASSNEGDLVLDPFCGCATTIIAANNLKRRWLGIDRRVDARYHIITRLMGIDRKERERIEKYATDTAWLEKQASKYDIHYQTDAPVRTDAPETQPPELPTVNPSQLGPLHSHAEMHQALVDEFGLKCWGCNFQAPDKRYLHLDHIIPKSEGGSNDIDNRALLCQPCNSKKSNTMSLTALRRENRREGYTQPADPVDLKAALAWTRNYLIQTIREAPYQTYASATSR